MWKRKSGTVSCTGVVAVLVLAVLAGCEKLNNLLDPPENPTPTPTSFPLTFTPTPRLDQRFTSTPLYHEISTPTPRAGTAQTPTPSPTNGNNESMYVTEKGECFEFPLGERTSGTFYFEARGFDGNKYGGGDESWKKPVYFWLYNDNSGFDYDGPGLLFQVLQLLHAGYWCEGGKLHLRNHDTWLGEICYQFRFNEDQWYSFEITWEDRNIHLFINGILEASAFTDTIAGPVTAGIGWPPARREGIEGLQYRNFGFR